MTSNYVNGKTIRVETRDKVTTYLQEKEKDKRESMTIVASDEKTIVTMVIKDKEMRNEVVQMATILDRNRQPAQGV